MYKKFTRIYRQLVQISRNTAHLAQSLTCAKNITVPDHFYVLSFAQIEKAQKKTLYQTEFIQFLARK